MAVRGGHFPFRLRLPLFLQISAVFLLLMLVPAIVAAVQGDNASARAFLYSVVLGGVLVSLLALVTSGRAMPGNALGELLALLGTMALLPALLAVPVGEAMEWVSPLDAYVDMVSAITTTGALTWDEQVTQSEAVHLWRALVAWVGGLTMWVAASAVLAPLLLGGFEMSGSGAPGRAVSVPGLTAAEDPRPHLWIHARRLAPIYTGLTALLALVLVLCGDRGFVAICHAMSIMATSGISPVGGLEGGVSGRAGEAAMIVFMCLALSRLTFSRDIAASGRLRLVRDPELRIGLVIVFGVAVVLFIRHWLAAQGIERGTGAELVPGTLWGGLFTAMSFLTTTGFLSADWVGLRPWSGSGSPGIILLGLAVVGGGVATTAGGVKLLRVWALYLSGLREMARLVHPSAVNPPGDRTGRIQGNGAFLAWVAFMLFALSLAAICLGFAAMDVHFEDAVVLTVSGLSNTGPLIQVVPEQALPVAGFGTGVKLLYCAAMVLGRLETLAIVALAMPELWRA